MQTFWKELRDRGFRKTKLIDTCDGVFFGYNESIRMVLSRSALPVGVK